MHSRNDVGVMDSTDDSVNDILLQLDPNIRRCQICIRSYNITLQKEILRFNYYCFQCWFNPIKSWVIRERLQELGGIKYLERIYLDRYDITINTSHYFTMTPKEKKE